MAKKGGASRIAVWVILGLLFFGLIGFGASDFGGSIRSVATVGDEEVDIDEYARALQQEIQGIARQTGRPISMAEAQAFGISDGVLARLINDAALDGEAARLGISVGDEAVRDQVATQPQFRGIDGAFDREAYAFTLQRIGLSISDYEESVRQQTARNMLQGALVGGLASSDTFVDTLYTWGLETRDITWALLTPEDLTEPLGTPSEEDLVAYHAANEAAFTLGETKAVTYALLTPDMILDEIEADEDALLELYDQRIETYVQPERRILERLVFGTEDDATAAKAEIDAGTTTFDDLVEARGLTLEDVDLGVTSEADLGEAGAGVFALTAPGIAGPLPSTLGPALFRVNALLDATEVTFEEARDELLTEYATDRARRLVEEEIGPIDDLLAGGATIEDLTAETPMELGTIAWRPEVTEGVAAYQGFRDAALVTTTEDFPELLEIDEGLLVLRVDEVQPPALQPLENVREDVIAAWEVEQAEARLTTQAQDAAQALRDGSALETLGLTFTTQAALERGGFLENAPAGFVENIFQMAEGDVRVFDAEGGAALARLDAITAPDAEGEEAETFKSELARNAEAGIAQDILTMFATQLQAQTDVEINQSALNAVHTQLP